MNISIEEQSHRPQISNTPQATGRNIEQFQVDDSDTATGFNNSPSSTSTHSSLSILSFPFTLTFNFISYILRLLRIPTPRLFLNTTNLGTSWNAFTSLWRPTKREPPGVVAERWVRNVEDEVGGLTWARLRAAEVTPEGIVEIPEFYLGSYHDAINVARRELRILCVVLLSEEHEDTPQFKRCEIISSISFKENSNLRGKANLTQPRIQCFAERGEFSCLGGGREGR